MKYEIYTEIKINATSEKVWDTLVKFEDYPSWNPFIQSIEGNVAVGNIIQARIKPPQGQVMLFKPKVLAFEQNKEFRWKGKLFFKGLFDGEHCFKLVSREDGTTLFQHSENFSGLLVRFFKSQLEQQTKRGFIEMNEALKKIVEN